jgi:hypothetical protein
VVGRADSAVPVVATSPALSFALPGGVFPEGASWLTVTCADWKQSELIEKAGVETDLTVDRPEICVPPGPAGRSVLAQRHGWNGDRS